MRHAEVEYYPEPAKPVPPDAVDITARGTEQSRSSGRMLAHCRFDRVITSGLPRTEQTARLVVEELHHKPQIPEFERWPELQELRGGSPDSVPPDQLADAFLNPFRGAPPMDVAYTGGETVGSLVKRVSSSMQRLYADPSWNTILLVAHGGVNRCILSWVLTGGSRYFGHFEQSFACINIIDGEPDHLILRTANLTPFDPAHLSTRRSTVEIILDQYLKYRAASTAPPES